MCNIVILGITKTKADKPNKKGLRRDFASRGQESSDSAFLSNRIKCKCIFVSFDNSPINCMIIERYRNIALKKLSKISLKQSYSTVCGTPTRLRGEQLLGKTFKYRQ